MNDKGENYITKCDKAPGSDIRWRSFVIKCYLDMTSNVCVYIYIGDTWPEVTGALVIDISYS